MSNEYGPGLSNIPLNLSYSLFVEYDRYDSLDVEQLLEESRQREEERLRQSLERIDQQLERREELFSETVEELESKLDWYIERLEQEYRQFFAGPGDEDELKKKIDEFYELLRDERSSLWEDKQALEQERRELLRELDEVEDSGLLELMDFSK